MTDIAPPSTSTVPHQAVPHQAVPHQAATVDLGHFVPIGGLLVRLTYGGLFDRLDVGTHELWLAAPDSMRTVSQELRVGLMGCVWLTFSGNCLTPPDPGPTVIP